MDEGRVSASRGLKCLLHAAKREHAWTRALDEGRVISAQQRPFHLDRHPFGFPLERRAGDGHLNFQFCGTPAATSVSVRTFTRELTHILPSVYPVRLSLRVMSGQIDQRQPKHHHIFFEVGFGQGIYLMCGGCTDCSGEGGHGREELESVFRLLAQTFDVKIDRAEIPYTQTHQALQRLDHLWSHRI